MNKQVSAADSDSGLTEANVTQQVWHVTSREETLHLLATQEEGLSEEAVAARRRQFGPNVLPEKKRAGLWQVFLRQFKDPLIYILLIAGVVSAAIGNFKDAVFIFIVLLVNEVPDAVERCHQAGVQVRMVTGDHPTTGLAIARQLGIAEKLDEVMTGAELAELENRDLTLKEEIRQPRVFARVEPAQKTTLVKSLQRVGHFVAVTGDGVNDAPALRAANIGVAMGKSGTDVARNAADLILTDDNFASIVNGIEEGRIAYDNVRKVTWLLLSTGAAEIILFFLAFLTGLPLPLSPVQLLWLNLVTNGIQDVALAFEKGEPGVLKRRPRPPDQPIFERRMIEETLLSGIWMGAVGFAVFYGLHVTLGWNEFDARNVLLLLMVLFENIHAFNCRSEDRSLFRLPLRANPFLVIAVLAAQSIHIAAMFIPGLNGVLEIQPVSLETWGILLLLAASLAVVVEIYKFIKRRAAVNG